MNTAELIVRVLGYQRGFTEPDPLIAQHVEAISKRYSELKRTHGFEDAARTAAVEWVDETIAALRLDRERLDLYEEMVRDGVRPGPSHHSEFGFQGWEWEGHKNPLFRSLREVMDYIRAARNGGGK